MNAITINNGNYTVKGTVYEEIKNNGIVEKTTKGIVDLHVIAYDEDKGKDDYLGIGVTNKQGEFTIQFNEDASKSLLDRKPDLYFIVEDGGLELLNTKKTNHVIDNADESTPPINLYVDLSGDKLRTLVTETPVSGWKGGYSTALPQFAYPDPNLNALLLQDNMVNIDKLERQQKVLWPEFSWEVEKGNSKTRCYQMFAPDISRLGYNSLGRVFSIICPQQGYSSPTIGSFNVEVTVTGNRGWADEDPDPTNPEIKPMAADMSVAGKIWFAPSAKTNKFVKIISAFFDKMGYPFPLSKANAIVIPTSLKGDPGQPMFPLRKGSSTWFEIPDFARHDQIAWNHAHLDVQIGGVEPTGVPLVDDFNNLILDLFNLASGNMLQKDNILSWNVWFNAPETVNQDEWRGHAEKWRTSIDVDNTSPDGPASKPRYFNGAPFTVEDSIGTIGLAMVIKFIKDHINPKFS